MEPKAFVTTGGTVLVQELDGRRWRAVNAVFCVLRAGNDGWPVYADGYSVEGEPFDSLAEALETI